jgi:hypothetical protein
MFFFRTARRLPRSRLRAATLSLLLFACGAGDEANRFTVTERNDDVEYRAEWHHRSFEVDADLTLVTVEGPERCVSTGSLVVNDLVSEESSYRLEPTGCEALQLTAGGDIVLQGAATGHDWTRETLSVDTEQEIVMLGPVPTTDPETGIAVSYRFTLSAPPCPDAPDCDCAALQRLGGATAYLLDLGRKCD